MSLVDELRDLIEHDRDTARRLLRQMAAALPGSVETHQLLAGSYMRSLEYAAAAETYHAVLALAPQDSIALNGLAFCHLARGDDESGLAAFRHAAAVTASAASMNYVAATLHRLGRLDEAIQLFEAVRNGLTEDRPEAWYAARGALAVLRDAGRTGEADLYAQALHRRFQDKPVLTASSLNVRNQSLSYHEWLALVDKARLALTLQQALAEDGFGARVPQTFVLPDQRDALLAFAAAAPEPPLFILKPIHGSGGQGISIVRDLAGALDREDVIVQRYLERPLLIDGRKSHLRIYALITSAEPLRAYVYSEGIVRFAPEPYDPRPERLAEVSMHVTNTALHLDHPGLVISQDPTQDDVGVIWSLSALLRRLVAEGRDPQAVFGEIQALAAWFLRHLRRDGVFARQMRQGPSRAYGHKLFGFDMLLDEDCHPWLIEIQTSPAASGAPLVNQINSELFKTMFRMANTPLELG